VASEAEKARNFARLYRNLVEALLQVGVVEQVAREEARIAAMVALQMADAEERVLTYEPHLGPCPTCQRG
jgi:hypothetical protein